MENDMENNRAADRRVFTGADEIAAFAASHRIHLALGYFDGLHLGHQALLQRVLRLAAEDGGEACVLMMEPSPRTVVHRAIPAGLTLPEEKIRLIQCFGRMRIFRQTFDLCFAALAPEDFVRKYLVGLFHAQTAVCGYNYSFGKNGAGKSGDLRRLAALHGFACDVLPRVGGEEKAISSTAIRRCIERGEIAEAHTRLGHGHRFAGQVVSGNRLGSRMGFPTANIALGQELAWPAFGVYGAFLRDADGRIYRGIVNVGVRPTVEREEGAPSFEAHLLDFHGDLYGKWLSAVLTDRIRPEARFSGLDALRAQIAADIEKAGAMLDTWAGRLAEKGWGPEAVFTCFSKNFPV